MWFSVLSGCNNAINDMEAESEGAGPPPEAMEFASLERFQSAYSGGGLAHFGIDSSAKLYLPAITPDGYELYTIAVSYGSISLRSLPEEHTDSQWSILEAQNSNKHFALWYALPNDEIPNTPANLLEQFGAGDKDLINDKYIFASPASFFWVEEETMFSVSLPLTMVTPFASALRDENIDGTAIMDYEGFNEILKFLHVEVLQ